MLAGLLPVNDPLNPQKISFYEFDNTNSLAGYDAWSNPSTPSLGKCYMVMFDKNYDNVITVGGKDVHRCVVVWSVGKDRKNYYTGETPDNDDVASWK